MRRDCGGDGLISRRPRVDGEDTKKKKKPLMLLKHFYVLSCRRDSRFDERVQRAATVLYSVLSYLFVVGTIDDSVGEK